MTKTGLAGLGLLALCAQLSACAAPAPVAAATASRQPAAAAVRGVVAAVRPVGNNSLGVSNVLSALNQPDPAPTGPDSEIVIIKSDGSTISTVQTGAAANLQPGDHVLVIAGASTEIVRQY